GGEGVGEVAGDGVGVGAGGRLGGGRREREAGQAEREQERDGEASGQSTTPGRRGHDTAHGTYSFGGRPRLFPCWSARLTTRACAVIRFGGYSGKCRSRR